MKLHGFDRVFGSLVAHVPDPAVLYDFSISDG